MFAGASSTGFYHAPFSKGLLVLTGTASFFNILFASSTRHLFRNISWIQIVHNSKLWQVLSSSFYFSSARNLICGSFLLYSFRIFERRFGSKRYASYIFCTSVIAIGLQLTSVTVLKHFGHEVGLPPPGLFGVLFATLVKYFYDIPASDAITFFGFPISGKIFIYSIALQMLLASRESLVAGICGMVAGFIYRINLLQVQQFLKLPESLTSAVSRAFGGLFSTEIPPTQPYAMGATLEIQRAQQVEHYEQQALRARMGNLRNRVEYLKYAKNNGKLAYLLIYMQSTGISLVQQLATISASQDGPPRVGQGYADVLVPTGGGGWLWGGAGGQQPPPVPPMSNWHDRNVDVDNANIPQQPTVEVSEQQVQTLVEMGFSRMAVLHALTASNNDITVATNILLSQS